MIFEVPLGSILGSFGVPKNQIKAPFSPEGPRRVPGWVLGVIFDDFGSHVRCMFDNMLDVFGGCVLAVFFTQQMYEMCMN